MATFTRTEILEGLQRLGELAQEEGTTVQLTLMGGAVMVLAFEARHGKHVLSVNWQKESQVNVIGMMIG